MKHKPASPSRDALAHSPDDSIGAGDRGVELTLVGQARTDDLLTQEHSKEMGSHSVARGPYRQLQKPPDEHRDACDESDLGEVLHRFERPSVDAPTTALSIGGVALFIAMILPWTVKVDLDYAPWEPVRTPTGVNGTYLDIRPWVTPSDAAPFCGFLILLAICVGLAKLWRARAPGGRSATVHAHGLVYTAGGQRVGFRWVDVIELRSDLWVGCEGQKTGPPGDRHLLVLKSGEQVLVETSFADNVLVLPVLHRKLEHLVREASERLAKSEPVTLGSVTLSKAGVTLPDGRRLPLAGLRVALEAERSTTYLRGPLYTRAVGSMVAVLAFYGPHHGRESVPLAGIPNAFILLSMRAWMTRVSSGLARSSGRA